MMQGLYNVKIHDHVCGYKEIPPRILKLGSTVIPRLTSDPANEFFG